MEKTVEQAMKNTEEYTNSMDNRGAFFFKFVLKEDRLVVRVGDIYIVSGLGNDANFVVMDITCSKSCKFFVGLNLVAVENSVIKNVIHNFKLSVGIEFVQRAVVIKKSVKFSSWVDNLTCLARSRMSEEMVNNDTWYRKLCRKFHVGSIIRTNIASNIKMMARSASINVGTVDMAIDPYLFNLNESNKFRKTFSLCNFCELDSILGCRWDIKPHKNGDPNSFFNYVTNVVIFVDKQDLLKVRFTYAGSTFPFCENYRERIADSNVVHTDMPACSGNESATSFS